MRRWNVPKDSRKPRRKIGMSEPAPALVVRLLADTGRLPKDHTFELPERVALSLIASRRAVAVGAYKQETPDLVLDETDWEAATA